MRVTCRQEDLARGLSTVSRAVAARSTLPILSNILLETDQERLKISATNLEIGISAWVAATIEDSGAVTVPARLLADFVNSLPPELVRFELVERSQTLKLASDRFKAEIKGIDATDFPVLAAVDAATPFTLDPSHLREMIGQVTIAAATDESRPVLTGVLTVLDPDAGTVTLAAADGFRLSVCRTALSAPLEGKLQVIIPARALLELGRLCGDAEVPVQVAVTGSHNQIQFKLPAVEIVSQLIDGNFPDYERILPGAHSTRAAVNAKALHGAVRIASFFARDAANVVRLKFEPGDELRPGTVVVSAQAAEVGGNESELEASIEGEPIEIAFNAKYLLDLLGAVGADQVAIEMTTPASPGLFRPIGDTDFTHVIMPMHIAR